MEVVKECSQCGYITESDGTFKCPICGGGLKTPTSRKACDDTIEKQWNNGYHDDFMEKRKTGSYCDPRLEKYTNGGEHYHGQETPQFSISGPKVQNLPKLTAKRMFLIGFFLGILFNLLGVLFASVFRKKAVENGEEPKDAAKLIMGSIVGTFIIFVLSLL